MKYGYGVVILAITGFMISDTYYEGKYMTLMKSWTKYYKMAGYAFMGISLIVFLRKNPDQAKGLVMNASDIVKYMPIDRNAADMLTPLVNAMNPQSFFNKNASGSGMGGGKSTQEQRNTDTIMSSGKKSTKRSVSETKKKFVAAQQSWTCNKCKKQLPAWFEVDHRVRLEYGGSNHVDNLEALCRDCHGRKTAMENL